jgi:hypothetical protein
MGYIRFWRRIKIFTGIFLNIGKKGISLSFGPKGIKYTKGTSGERISIGLPGTGIYYIDEKRRSQKSAIIEPATQTLEDLKKEIEGK